MKTRLLISAVTALSLSACTWVKPTEEAEQVQLVKSHHVNGCERLGATTSSVKHEVGPIKREQEAVREELIVLAKNEAAAIGGDTIVAQDPPREGRMKFDIYRCRD